jgi:hypothetical protein
MAAPSSMKPRRCAQRARAAWRVSPRKTHGAPSPASAVTGWSCSACREFTARGAQRSTRYMKSALDVTLAYPTYREGLAAILAQESRV